MNGVFNLTTKQFVSDEDNGTAKHLESCGLQQFLKKKQNGRIREATKDFVAERAGKSPGVIHEELTRIAIQQMASGEQATFVTKRQVRDWVLKSQVRRADDGQADYVAIASMDNPFCPGKRFSWLRKAISSPTTILLFMSEMQQDWLVQSQVWLIDSTFKIAPGGFLQVLNVMGVRFGQAEQYGIGAHILMKRREISDYKLALQELLNLIPRARLALKAIVMDFEAGEWKGVTLALQEFQLRVRLRGCLFHFNQALRRKFEKAVRLKDKNQRKVLSCMMWFPYLEDDIITRFMTELRGRETGMEQFLIYFEQTWWPNKDRWKTEKEIEMDVYTNCALEGYHGRLHRHAPFKKPTIKEMAESLFNNDMQQMAELVYATFTRDFGNRKTKRCEDFRRHKPRIIETMQSVVQQFPLQRPNRPDLQLPIIEEEEDDQDRDEQEINVVESIQQMFSFNEQD